MTRLIVSVRNAAEARAAWAAGVHLIDIKEPLRGSLGAADGPIVRGVMAALPSNATVSVALGELLEVESPLSSNDLYGVAFAKLGLAGCVARNDWQTLWQDRMRLLPDGVQRVAVVNADAKAAGPPLPDVLSLAVEAGAAA